MDTQPKLSTADSLRLLADWYEAHPEIGFTDEISVASGEAMEGTESETVRIIARALGTFEKQVSDSLFKLTGTFGGVRVKFLFWRSLVCTPRVVGKKTVKVKKPAVDVPMIESEEEQDVIAWDCPPLLADTEPTEREG